jgi:uncharacterized membrane protein YedE/YeeE
MVILAQLIIGLLFGTGLVVSGMINPAKVLNFLDLAGSFDPSLAFVMAGAVAVTALGYRIVLTRPRPVLASSFHLPSRQTIDARLIAGAAIFGVGWGLSGLCPGPAISSLGLGAPGVLAFVPAMLAGMAMARFFASRWAESAVAHQAGTAARFSEKRSA